MKITKITQQVKRASRYSIFVDEKYSFSLSESALLEAGLASGQELTKEQVAEFKKLSADDKVYGMALRWIAMRPRTGWEIEQYLKRKEASPALIEIILNKLSIIGLIDDEKLAKAFVNDRRLLRPAPRRKIILELRKKHVAEDIIREAVGNDSDDERTALAAVIERKRRQSKYQDDLKLMQYLARQGFNYGDIKAALEHSREDN
ncbi:MAG TPA: RecX family transcriptional regulator [Candidatus Saccharimonadales bacterium]|nr:RecX family transcriptional regulator [Candidatus Saccharimonadales bacterium]